MAIDKVALKDVLEDVVLERFRQEKLWGQQDHHVEKWVSILLEEVGEVALAVNQASNKDYRRELVQVAAVAIQMVEALDRSSRGRW